MVCAGLYKTEMCRNWKAIGRCSYGNKCRFAHGELDVKNRVRSETYNTKVSSPAHSPAFFISPMGHALFRSLLRSLRRPPSAQPCTDLARDGSRTCTYGKRCNYAHPGDSIRRVSTGIKLGALCAGLASSAQQPGSELLEGGYMDAQYEVWTRIKYPTHKHPFGIFV